VTDPGAGLPPFPSGATVPSGARALVLTISDGVVAGTRQDESGMVLGDRLAMAGFRVDRQTVPDDKGQIAAALRSGAADHSLVISTGGTGLTPRDVTPQATLAAVEYEVPGLAEAMRAAGRARTPMADLSRGVVGVIGQSLVVNVPGSARAALESLVAIEATLGHALETLAGPYDHSSETSGSILDMLSASTAMATSPSSVMPSAPAAATPSALPPATPSAVPPATPTSAGTPAPGDQADPWRDLPHPEERGVEDRNVPGAG
jgi:molybdenum cofactor biosynthesis protein B